MFSKYSQKHIYIPMISLVIATFLSACSPGGPGQSGLGMLMFSSSTSISVSGLNINVIATPISSTLISENGDSADYMVSLSQQPSGTSIYSVSIADNSIANVTPGQLTFTPENWNVPQQITIQGLDNELINPDTVINVQFQKNDDLSTFRSPDQQGISVTIVSNDVKRISTGREHSCALSVHGNLRCWGGNANGQLGYNDTFIVGDGSPDRSISDMKDVPVGGVVTDISLGNQHTCARLLLGKVRCWGKNSSGQLGYNNTQNVGDGTGQTISEMGDVTVGARVNKIVAGGYHTCALLANGAVRCWGQNNVGQLGYDDVSPVGNGNRSITDVGDVNIGGTAVDIAAGRYHTCVIMDTGAVRCWGKNVNGELGYDDTDYVGKGHTPGRTIIDMGDVPLGTTALSIQAGHAYTCVVTVVHNVRCWGAGGAGRLGHNGNENIGNGVTDRSIIDMGDVPVGAEVEQLSLGINHTCALLRSGAARCWGNANDGQLGYGDQINVGTGNNLHSIQDMGNLELGGADIVQMSAGGNSTCALLSSGDVQCWGANGKAELGYGHTVTNELWQPLDYDLVPVEF